MSTADSKIWIGQDGQKYGPYSEVKVRQWLAEAKLTASTMAWRSGMADWAALGIMLHGTGDGALPPPPPLNTPPEAQNNFPTSSLTERPGVPHTSVVATSLDPTISGVGPFGLRMGMSIAELGMELVEISPTKYKAILVPKPHSAFEYYVLQISPNHGLSWIKGIGVNIATNVYGAETSSAFKSMHDNLVGIYGGHFNLDRLEDGSIWNEPRDWTSSIVHGERALSTLWSEKTGAFLNHNLKAVSLHANQVDTTIGYLTIEYSFKNSDAVDADLASRENSAL